MSAPPFKIETGIPMPERRCLDSELSEMRAALRKMKVGDSFTYSRNQSRPYEAARKVGVRISMRKINGEGWRVWLIEKAKVKA